MCNVFSADEQGGTAQVSLCDEVDRTLAAVDRRRTVSSLQTHWCSRWGLYHSYDTRPMVPSIQSTLSSTSSSSESSSTTYLHPARTKAMVKNGLGKHSNQPVDFLGTAASWGLSRYVTQMLDSQSKPPDRDTANYLLCCSMWAFRDEFYLMQRRPDHDYLYPPSEDFDLIAELLRRGGDPNI